MSRKKRVMAVIVFGLITSIFLSTVYAADRSSPKERQMWNLQNADIRAVIQTVSELTHKNFVVDPRVQGHVTLVSAKPMSPDEMYTVFLSMLQVLNYSAIPAGDVIKIIPSMDAKGYGGTLVNAKSPGSGDQVVVRVVPVNNVSAMQLVSIIRPLMLDWGSVNAYQPSNALVLAGPAANINQLIAIVTNLDQNNGSTVQVLHLKYADATKLAQVIQALQSSDSGQGKVSNVSVVADPSDNALLVSGNATNRKKSIELIRQLDTVNAAGENNTAVIHLNYLTAKELAPMLTKLAHGFMEEAKKNVHGGVMARAGTFGVGAESDAAVSIQAVKDANAIVMSGPHEVIQSLEKVIKKIDTRPQEVLVQAIIVKIDESAMSQLGIQWGMGNPNPAASEGSALSQAFQNGLGYIRNGSFSAVIQALMTNANTDILATPSILVLNNQKASISDGKNIGMYNRQYGASTAGTAGDSTLPYNTYDRKDVTLSLNVTPQIAPDNTVKLKIRQKDDSLMQGQDANNPNPTINTSKIDTSVLVNSGDILVLGGLISNNDTLQDQKIPILGDIPLIGKLFHSTQHNVEKKNLMVFIRPVIINNKEDAQVQSMKKYNFVRYQQMRRKDGMGLSNADRYPVLPYVDSHQDVTLPDPFNG